ncbi:MAG: cyclase family protein [Candidatus Harrisonbacteria bacterium]|nr:cyclase family protein [Candidatus Harrisonbacteria bacterium]
MNDNFSEKEVLSYLDSLSNWERWGKEDELGTINFINPKKVKKSLALVRDGVSVTCARPIESSPEPDLKTQALRKEIDSGEGRRAGLEYIGMVFHGNSITHIDSPAHYFWKGKMYNNRPADLVSSREGAQVNDVEVLRNGIITRGVLLDVAAIKNKKWLESGEAVTVADLEAAEKIVGVKVESGDVLLVRTGNYKRILETKENIEIAKEPGLSAAAMPWLREREVSIIGSDTANSHKSNLYPNINNPFHVISLVSMGLWILDNANLEELAKVCKEKKRWEFLISINPLRLKNATGSPVNPVAIF